jgi:nucleoside-triphosphatase THEP1
MLRQPASETTFKGTEPLKEAFHMKGGNFNYSVSWLIINIILIIGSFFLLSLTSWPVWSSAITAIIILWASRYRRAMRQLKKPKFWIFFVAITIITAFVFTKARPGESFWETGLLTGIQMNFRAVVIIVGFSTLGTELYNPVVRNFFMGTRFKNLPLALELSAESLPSFIASIPDFNSMVKNPVSVFYRVLSQADLRLSEIREKNNSQTKAFIISGSRDEGKTSYSEKLVSFLKENNTNPSGIIAKKIFKGSELCGYDLEDVSSGETKRFLRTDEKCGTEKIGKYTICPEGLAFGEKILNDSALKNSLVLVDEVGLLELEGRGWSGNIEKLISAGARVIFVVRDEFVKRVIDKWNLTDQAVFKISEVDFRDAGKIIQKS